MGRDPLQLEDVNGLVQTLHKDIYVVLDSIYVETCAGSCSQTETLHQRLRTVMAGSHGYSNPLVENGGQVVRVNITQCKGYHTAAQCCRGSINGQTWDLLELLQGIAGQFLFVAEHVLHAQRREIIDRC